MADDCRQLKVGAAAAAAAVSVHLGAVVGQSKHTLEPSLLPSWNTKVSQQHNQKLFNAAAAAAAGASP